MKAPLYNPEGERIGEIDLPEEIFGVQPKRHVLWEVTRMYLANRRVGTHRAKTRGEVVGSTAKIWPQKGLGRARHGDIKAPIFVGGGKAHGPRPRSYRYQVPKKVRRLALKMALSDRAREGKVLVFEAFQIPEPKTRLFQGLLNKLELNGHKVLFLLGEYDRNVYLSSRNIPKVNTELARDTNALSVLNSEYIVLDKQSLDVLKTRLAS